MRTIWAVILLFLSGHGYALAYASKPVVSIKVVKPSEPLTPGKPATLRVELAISSPYHINSDRPLSDYLIPTTVKFESQAGVQVGKVQFPAAQVLKLMNEQMSVFTGDGTISVEIIPAADLTEKEIHLKGVVGYQACNDRVCLPPVREALDISLPVGAPGPASNVPAPYVAEARSSGGSPGSTKSFFTFEDKSLFVIFLLVFIGGLALNLTPCVYPMIPITITYFGGQAQGRKGSLFIHSMLYTIGMAVTYSVLGVIAAMTGGLLGSALRYPIVLIGIACVMVLLSLSMFDVYEFRMPGFLNRLAGGSQKGFTGTFLMGLTVGIVAAPCIGPFVFGLLTFVGNKGSVVLGFLLFFVLALGLGIPFLVLGMFSGSIRRLPRSGAWMVWVRKIFGFVLLAMAVFFLKTLFSNLLAYQLTLSTILFLAGIYLAWIDPIQTVGKAFPFIRNIVGVVFFAAAIYGLAAILQEQVAGAVRRPAYSAGSVENEKSIQWHRYSEEILRQALRQTKPVFIDFYADWCAPCKELDKETFSSPEVVSLSNNFMMLKVDLTSADNPNTEALREKYQARGVPTLVFLKPDGEEMPDLRATGFEPKEVFVGRMKQALQRAGGSR
jgi:thioredoxin:protein disulfide reductase